MNRKENHATRLLFFALLRMTKLEMLSLTRIDTVIGRRNNAAVLRPEKPENPMKVKHLGF